MLSIEESVTQYLSAIEMLETADDSADWSNLLDRANEAIGNLGTSASNATRDELRLAAQRLFPSLEMQNPEISGHSALLLGAFIEFGLEVGCIGSQLLSSFREVLELAVTFVERVEADHPAVSEEDIEEELEEELEEEKGGYWVGDRFVSPDWKKQYNLEDCRLPQAYAALNIWCLPVAVALSRDRNLLLEAQANDRLVTLVDRLTDHGMSFVQMLLKMLLDEPLLVLHPSTNQGFRVVIDGITDNFQLHILLADALVVERRGLLHRQHGPESGIPGVRPSSNVVAVARGDGPQSIEESSNGVWNPYLWTAIDTDAKLSDNIDMKHWIWNEGIPADIIKFEGVRVVLLGPPAYPRSWNTVRNIDTMKARVEVQEVLDSQQVTDWLTRFASAKDHEAN